MLTLSSTTLPSLYWTGRAKEVRKKKRIKEKKGKIRLVFVAFDLRWKDSFEKPKKIKINKNKTHFQEEPKH